MKLNTTHENKKKLSQQRYDQPGLASVHVKQFETKHENQPPLFVLPVSRVKCLLSTLLLLSYRKNATERWSSNGHTHDACPNEDMELQQESQIKGAL